MERGQEFSRRHLHGSRNPAALSRDTFDVAEDRVDVDDLPAVTALILAEALEVRRRRAGRHP
jgi:hypothetical protein